MEEVVKMGTFQEYKQSLHSDKITNFRYIKLVFENYLQ